MAKTSNLTIRLEPKLRQQAEDAAHYFDTDLSKEIRKALRRLIQEHRNKVINEARYERAFMDSESAGVAVQALHEKIQAHGGGLLQTNVPQDQIARIVEGDISGLPRDLRRKFQRDKKRGKV